jgi:FkbM family methyltransferase
MKTVAWKNLLLIEGDNWVSKWVKESDRLDHDQWLLRRVEPYIEPDGVVVDIGAYIGDHTVAYVRWAPRGEVYAFEPNRIAFSCLVHNLIGMFGGAQKGLHIINHALGARNEYKTLYMPKPDNPGMARMASVESTADGEQVVVDTLDSYKISPSFIKIDVEGSELEVLDGAVETIKRGRPVMLIEYNEQALNEYYAGWECNRPHTEEDFLARIKSLGYRVETFVSRDILDRAPAGQKQYDLLCLPL